MLLLFLSGIRVSRKSLETSSLSSPFSLVMLHRYPPWPGIEGDLKGIQVRDSWMYPNVPRNGKSLYKPYVVGIYGWNIPQESLENTINTISAVLGVHPIVPSFKGRGLDLAMIIGFLSGVVIPLIFPKVPQSSQTESLGFVRNTPPLEHSPLKNPTRLYMREKWPSIIYRVSPKFLAWFLQHQQYHWWSCISLGILL